MLDILAITTPIYLVIAVGYMLVRVGFIKPVFVEALGQFAIRVSLPMLIFLAIAGSGQNGGLHLGLMAGYAVASLPLLIAGRFMLRHILGQRPGQSWSMSLGIANPNSVMIGLPLATIIFPEQAATVFASFMLVENVIFIPLTLIAADLAGRKSQGLSKTLSGIGRSLIGNPLLTAVLLALLARGLNWAPAGAFEASIRLLGQTGPGLALFYIGATVARLSLTAAPAIISTITLGKLIIHPLIAALVFPWFVSDPTLVAVAILFCAIPMLTIYPLLARKSDSEDLAATALLVATSLSFITVSATLYLIRVLI